MPLIVGGGPSKLGRKPKFTPAGYSIIPYGAENVCILSADVDAATHTTISADSQVSAFPANLLANLTSGAVTQAQGFLDGLNIPSQWVNTGITYIQMILIIGRIFEVSQMFERSIGKLFANGITLSTTFSALPIGTKNTLTQIATSRGWDTSGLTGSSTMRQILKFMADQFPDPIQILGITF
jgi:hypothetical protein